MQEASSEMDKNIDTSRVLFVGDFDEVIGGAEKYMLALQDYLNKNGIQTKTIAITKIAPINHISSFGAQLFKILLDYFNPKIFFEVKKIIREFKPDVIHLHNNVVSPISVLMALKKDYNVIFTAHDHTIICPSNWCSNQNGKVCGGVSGAGIQCFECLPVHKLLPYYLLRKIRALEIKSKTNAIISPSIPLKEKLEKIGFSKLHHIPYFVAINEGYRPRTLTNRRNILYVGKLEKHKGIRILIEIFSDIAKKIEDFRLIIAGSGSLENELKDKVSRSNITDKVLFVGHLRTKDLIEWYEKADLLVIPSLWQEQFGIVGIEAMSFGLPVIGFNVGGIPDWLKNGRTGYLIEAGDKEGMKKGIINIFSDDINYNTFSKYALEDARSYAVSNHLNKMLEVYSK